LSCTLIEKGISYPLAKKTIVEVGKLEALTLLVQLFLQVTLEALDDGARDRRIAVGLLEIPSCVLCSILAILVNVRDAFVAG
jgi:hypothetical protein